MIIETEAARLYQADVRDVIADLPPAPLVVMDPPYQLTRGGRTGRSFGGWMAGYANDGRPVACDITWPEIMMIARSILDRAGGGAAYVMSNDRNLRDAMNAAADAGFGFHNLLTWDKGNATQSRWYRKTVEFCLFLYLGRAASIARPSSPSHVSLRLQRETDHPTEKPVGLLAGWIENSSAPGDLVVDPFMGSGSTGVAALATGRRFVGIETDKVWFQLASRRINGIS